MILLVIVGTHCVHPIATELSPLRRDGLVIPPREVEWPQDNAPRVTTPCEVIITSGAE